MVDTRRKIGDAHISCHLSQSQPSLTRAHTHTHTHTAFSRYTTRVGAPYLFFSMANATPKKAVVGIDLGATFSYIAVERKHQIEVLVNADGDRPTASAVFFDSPLIVGKSALEKALQYPGRTVHSVKRLIGRQFNEPSVQNLMNLVEYTIVNVGGELSIMVNVDGSVKTYRPEQISARILEQLKYDAEKFLGENVTGAVITVPVAFNEAQRLATKHAGIIAGFDVRAIINEPTAAAIAWAYSNPKQAFVCKPKLVLVFDMGGSTTDVSIVSVSSKEIRVISAYGDPQLGGNDIDNALVNVLVEEIMDKHERDISQDRKAMIRLRKHCKELKHQLSKVEKVTMSLENVMPGVPFKIGMSRARFERIIDDSIEKTIGLARKALKMEGEANAHFTKPKVDDIILVGGSSRMPWVERIFKDFLAGDKPVERTVNCDEAVAFGAGVYTAKLGGSNDILPDIHLPDFTPLSYDIGVRGRGASQRGAPASTSITTNGNAQESLRIQVHQGDPKTWTENQKLCEVSIPIQPAPEGVPDIHVTLSLSHDFKLTAPGESLAYKGEAKTVTLSALNAQEAAKGEAKRKALLDKLENLAYEKRSLNVLLWIEENRDASYGALTSKLEELVKK